MVEHLAKIQYDRAALRIQQRTGVYVISWGSLSGDQQAVWLDDVQALIDEMRKLTGDTSL